MTDKIIKALAHNGKIAITCINSTNLVEEARKIHDLSPVATAAFGRLLTIAAIMGNEMKNKKKRPLKAKMLLAPERKILSNPLSKIGKERSIRSISATNIKVKRILNKAIGNIIVFVFIIDFLPIIFATTPINKKRNSIKEIG